MGQKFCLSLNKKNNTNFLKQMQMYFLTADIQILSLTKYNSIFLFAATIKKKIIFFMIVG